MPSVEQVETLIIGGGQAGLTMSHRLSERGRPHLVLERRHIAERWRTERWDSLRLQGPNWSVRLPDFPFLHADPDGFATAGEIVEFITAYAAFIAAPVRCGVEVASLRRQDGERGFRAETSSGAIEARNVVVATGPYQQPRIPPLFQIEPPVLQLHASHYRNPDQLPEGAVLVIGAAASGAQIAEELLLAGRCVYLSIGQHRRAPRRYRGRDLHWWWRAMGVDRIPAENRGPDRSPVVQTGAYGGHTVDFRQFARQGMVLLGRAEGAEDGVIRFASDLLENLDRGDAGYRAFLAAVDAHVSRERLEMAEDPDAWSITPDAPALAQPLRQLDLRAAGVGTVIWAAGYGADFSWIEGLRLDTRGVPIHRQGITDLPGLYLLGLPFLSNMSSSFLSGVGDDAARLADHIVAHR